MPKDCKNVSLKTKTNKITISKDNLQELLGHAKYKDDSVSKKDQVGVVNGLAMDKRWR